MGGCSTIFAVPIYSSLAKIFACTDGEEGNIVASTTDLPCFEGAHLALSVLAGILGIVYSVLLIPHAVVFGDTDYVLYEDMFKWHLWRQNAVRKATLNYKGGLHPFKNNTFGHA